MRIGLPSLVFLVFLVLKLLGKLTWSWVWVTAPLWGAFAGYLVFFFVLAVLAVISERT